MHFRDFPGGPGFRTQCFHGQGQGSIPGWRTQILQTVQCGQKIRKKTKQNINVSLKKELAILISDERDFKKKRIIIDKWNYFTEKEKWSFSSSPPALSPPEIYITLYNKHFTFLSQTLRVR